MGTSLNFSHISNRIPVAMASSIIDAYEEDFTPSEMTCLLYHIQKPWIRNFRTVLIAPAVAERGEYLGEEIIVAPYDSRQPGLPNHWYFPSAKFWKAHAEVSHPEGGSGCDLAAHREFFTGKDREFYYATLTWADKLIMLDKEDFGAECDYWHKFMVR